VGGKESKSNNAFSIKIPFPVFGFADFLPFFPYEGSISSEGC
jgi:hypothetical protein